MSTRQIVETVFQQTPSFLRMPYPPLDSYAETESEEDIPPRTLALSGRFVEGAPEWVSLLDPHARN